MRNFINFFLVNERLNYVLMIFITFLGIFSYMNMPKDVFPPIKLDKILITGNYPGSSVDNLDKMAVTKLEDELRSIDGLNKMESLIKNSSFTITLTMNRGSDMQQALNDSKDIISNVKRYFPDDMDEPISKIATISVPILAVVISSESESIDDLIRIGKDIKTELTKVSGVSNVNLYAENDRMIEILLDSKKIDAYGVDKQILIAELQKFSYIYPAGKIEETGQHLFISTFNGQRSLDEILNIRLNIGDKTIYLKDIADVNKKYKENDVITRFNGVRNVEMGIFKGENGDSIEIAENVKKRIAELNEQYTTIKMDSYNDASKIVRNRLNTVVSSIFVGIILVGLSVLVLINARVSFVVTIGIPTALLIGAFMIYMAGYAINIMTLLGVLLILGVLVDDALLVAENIQRHIKMGEDKFHATMNGTKEVFTPVLASSLTTLFAFSPMFILTGEMGEFMKMIPIAIVALVIASLLESFVFLPLHAYHTLQKDTKELSWKPFERIYQKILRRVVRKSKLYVPLFWIGIPVATVLVFSTVKYQLFPDFDSDKFFIRGNFNVNHTVEEVAEKVKPIEKILLENKKELQIKSISLLSGYQNSNLGSVEMKPNVFEFFVELESKKPENFIDKYVTPIFAVKEDSSPKIRDLGVATIVDEVKLKVEQLNIEGLEELLIIRDKPAVAKYDIQIQLNSSDPEKLSWSLEHLKEEISKIDGILTYGDDAKIGIAELKLKPNEYGESLGFTETSLAQSIAPFFLEVEQGRGLGSEGIVEIVTREKSLNNLKLLKKFQIKTPDSSKIVQLSEVTDFIHFSNYDSLYKENGTGVKTVFANVNNDVITAVEVLEKLQPTMKKMELMGVNISLKGEQEQNERMKKELGLALIVAIFLIFITLLSMFNSFKSTFIILSVIPFSFLGAVLGHKIMGMNFAMPSVIGILGLAGVVINNGVVMLDFIRKSHNFDELLERATLRLRPIVITSLTTFIGLSTLIFFATGQATILQPIAVSLGYGLIWGTVLNLIYLPAFFAVLNRKQLVHDEPEENKTTIKEKFDSFLSFVRRDNTKLTPEDLKDFDDFNKVQNNQINLNK